MSVSVFLLVVLHSACNRPAEIGADFFTEESFNLEEIDSFDLRFSTIIRDSLATGNSNRLLVGRKVDADFGVVQSNAFFKLQYPSFPELEEDFVSFDSITMLLDYDGYFYYDTLKSATFSVHQLTEEIETDEERGLLYNNSVFDFNPIPLGTRTFSPRPLRDEPIEIRLDDAFGMELFQKILDDADELSSSTNFNEFIKGFAIVPSEMTDAALLGFNVNSGLRLHYSDNSELPALEEVFEISNNTALQFNQIIGDRAGTALENLEIEEEPLPSNLANKQAFIQNGTGLEMRIEIPNLRDLQAQKEDFLVSKATLELYPKIESLDDIEDLPFVLSVDWVDEDNDLVSSFSETVLEVDFEFNRDTRYSLDLTPFVDFQINRDEINEDALLFSISSPATNASVNRVVFGDETAEVKAEFRIFIVEKKE